MCSICQITGFNDLISCSGFQTSDFDNYNKVDFFPKCSVFRESEPYYHLWVWGMMGMGYGGRGYVV